MSNKKFFYTTFVALFAMWFAPQTVFSQIILEPVKPLPLMESYRWKLVYTSTEKRPDGDVWKWEHYESNDQAVRTITAKNGDFITIIEKPGGNYADNSFSKDERNIGGFRITFYDGAYVECYIDDPKWAIQRYRSTYIYHFPNGNILFSRNDKAGIGGLTMEKFLKRSDLTNKEKQYNDRKSILRPFFSSDSQEGYRFIFHDDPNHYYSIQNKGVRKSDRLYCIDEMGEAHAFMHTADGEHFYYASIKDTVRSVRESYVPDPHYPDGKIKKTYVYYTNDDYVVIKQGDVVEGKIHRNGGILEIKNMNNNAICRLSMPNGDMFTGAFLEFDESHPSRIIAGDFPLQQFLQAESLTPLQGVWIRNGKSEEIVNGMLKADYEKAVAAQRAQKNAKEQAAYNDLCKKYGKEYVDAALRGQIVVGMPEKLFLGIWKGQQSPDQQIGTSKLYRRWTSTASHKLIQSVWITDGRVSSIINGENYLNGL